WLDDPRFRTQADRIANADDRFDLTGQVLKTKTSAEWLAILDQKQVPCAPILSPAAVIEDAQVRHTRLIVEYRHPVAGRTRQTRPGARFDGAPQEIRRPAPALGQDTDEVLGELGLSRKELASLRAERVIG